MFADVILPLPLPLLYTYRIPMELEGRVSIGSRVVVQFGKKKILTSIVKTFHDNQPKIYELKSILELLDEDPCLNKLQLQLFSWMSEYYMCTLGEVINAALPSGLKLNSESKIQLNPEFNNEEMPFTDKEEKIIELLSNTESATYTEISSLLGQKNINSIIKSLLSKNSILLFEEVKEKYTPKKQRRVKLAQPFVDKERLEELFDQLEKKPAQTEILLRYLQQVTILEDPEINERGIEKNGFVKTLPSPSALTTLVKKRIFEEYEVIIPRFEEFENETFPEIALSEKQKDAKQSILDQFKEKEVVLLHGVTGSGKTEIYIELIKEAILGGSQVLYLLPEIALTTQIVTRLRKIFGEKVGIYHSKFSDNERVEVWKGVATGKISFVVGVRSSVFLPFSNLGLFIVDEEHESSYKQYDPAPRYHARDTALVLARLHHARTLLGSATPSMESYYNACSGKWGMVQLKDRFGGAQLPEILLADIRKEKKNKTMKNDFSSVLVTELQVCLEKKEQAILFQNRRGYAPYLGCEDCGHVIKCENCSVSLTYHMSSHQLRCHYCGHSEKLPRECPACGSKNLQTHGHGTEKIEENLKLILPEAKVDRMDLDTTRKKNSFQEILTRFGNRESDVLVGTQMVTKGLDFDHVSVVGIFDADRMIHYPDFRSFEKSFQMLSQVSGRAGRKEKKGRVIIQTTDPGNSLFPKVISNDYEGLYKQEISEREKFNYPPFARLIKLTVRDASKDRVFQTSQILAEELKKALGSKRILGPETPLIEKLRNYYLMEILIKLEKDKVNPTQAKALISKTINSVLEKVNIYSIQVVIDVDPI